MSAEPIEDYLDNLLRRTRADARTVRRLLDETADHLHAAAAELQASGLDRVAAEHEAVRRFGPPGPIARDAHRASLLTLVAETARGAVFLGGIGLAAIGLSGVVVLIMNVALGRAFVGGVSVAPFGAGTVGETADDAVVLRVGAGIVGLLMLLCHYLLTRLSRATSVLPDALIDALGAAAFAAGGVALGVLTVQQALRAGATGVGFPLSGAVVAVPAAVYFCARAAKHLLPAR